MQHLSSPLTVVDHTRFLFIFSFALAVPYLLFWLWNALFDVRDVASAARVSWHRWRAARRERETARRVEREIDRYGFRAGHGTTALHREMSRDA